MQQHLTYHHHHAKNLPNERINSYYYSVLKRVTTGFSKRQSNVFSSQKMYIYIEHFILLYSVGRKELFNTFHTPQSKYFSFTIAHFRKEMKFFFLSRGGRYFILFSIIVFTRFRFKSPLFLSSVLHLKLYKHLTILRIICNFLSFTD